MKSQSPVFNNKGFSLIEILIVLALVGGIVALIAKNVGGAQDNAKKKLTVTVMQQTISQLDLYNDDCGSYPKDLSALVKKPAGDECENWGPAPYTKEEPVDGWNRKFVYESDGTDFELISYGKDKKPGGSDAAADISSKKLR